MNRSQSIALSIALMVASGVLNSCRDDPTGTSTDVLPRVTLSNTFSVSPASGVLVLEPQDVNAGAGAWLYGVDFDEDGIADSTGVIDRTRSLAYAFEEAGPHRIAIRLTKSGESVELERFVVVNDPSAIETIGSVSVGPPGSVTEGIAVSLAGDRVFVGRSQTLLELDSARLALVDSLRLETAGVLEGMSVPPDEEVLYVIDKDAKVHAVTYPELEEVHTFEVTGRFFLHAEDNGQLYVSGESSRLELFNAGDGQLLRDFETSDAWHVAVSRDHSLIALADNVVDSNDEGAVILLDRSFNELWRRELVLSEGRPRALAFSPDGEKVYARYERFDSCGLLVLDVEDGTITRDFPFGSGCREPGGTGVANPVAAGPDGRFIAFPTGLGTFFVDTTIDLPLFSTTPLHGSFSFCCDVAASPTANEFYLSGATTATVVKVRLNR